MEVRMTTLLLLFSLFSLPAFSATVEDTCGSQRTIDNLYTYQQVKDNFTYYTDVKKFSKDVNDEAANLINTMKTKCSQKVPAKCPGSATTDINDPCCPTDYCCMSQCICIEGKILKDVLHVKPIISKLVKQHKIFSSIDAEKKDCLSDKTKCPALITGVVDFLKTTKTGKAVLDCLQNLDYKDWVVKDDLPVTPKCIDEINGGGASGGAGYAFANNTYDNLKNNVKISVIFDCSDIAASSSEEAILTVAHELHHVCIMKNRIKAAAASLTKAASDTSNINNTKTNNNKPSNDFAQPVVATKEHFDVIRQVLIDEIKVISDLELPLFKELVSKDKDICNDGTGTLAGDNWYVCSEAEKYSRFEKESVEGLLPEDVLLQYLSAGGADGRAFFEKLSVDTKTIKRGVDQFKKSSSNPDRFFINKDMQDLLDKNGIKVNADNRV